MLSPIYKEFLPLVQYTLFTQIGLILHELEYNKCTATTQVATIDEKKSQTLSPKYR